MSALWTDGTWTTESAVSGFRFESPIPGDKTPYLLQQDFIVLSANYSPPTMSTAHATTYTDYYFVGDSNFIALDGGAIRFTRTWAKVPAAHSEYETFTYPFIGFFGSYGPTVTIPTGRDRMVLPVQSRIYHEYFLCESGQTYTTPGAIPILQAQKYRILVSGLTWWMDIDWLSDAPPFDTATTPDRATYVGWISNAETNKWASGTISYAWAAGTPPTVTPTLGTNPGQLIAEDSRIDRWRGNIWLRRTRYVLAQ